MFPFISISRHLNFRVFAGVLFCLLFLWLAPVYAQAQAGKIWTLDDALAEAARANPTLAVAMAQAAIAEGGVLQAKAFSIPYVGTELAPAELTYRPVEFGTTARLGGKREIQIRIAKQQLDSTNATVRTMAWKVRKDTEKAFYDYAVSQKTLTVLQDYMNVTRRLLEIAVKRKNAGDVAGLDVMRAETAVSSVKTQIAPALAKVQQAQRQLNLQLGHEIDEPMLIALPEPVNLMKTPAGMPDFNQLVQVALAVRPEYRQYDAQIATERSRVSLAKAGWWPDIQFAAGVSMVATTRHSYLGEKFKYAPEVHAQIPLTLLSRRQVLGTQAIAEASVLQAKKQREAFDLQVEQEINLAYGALAGAEEQLRIYVSEILPQQEKILETSQRSYQLGFIDLTTAITAQQTALNAQISALQLLSQYFQGRIDLERAVGQPIAFEPSKEPAP